MKRRSTRFDPNAPPLLELSLEANKVQQQGLDEGWTLLEVGSKVEVLPPRSNQWLQAVVLGFATLEKKEQLYAQCPGLITVYNSDMMKQKFLSKAMVAHYDNWVLVKPTAKNMNTSYLWCLYNKEHSVLKPLKNYSLGRNLLFSKNLLAVTTRDNSSSNLVETRKGDIISLKFDDNKCSKRKRDKVEQIVFGEDFEILKKTCYTQKKKLNRGIKIKIHEVLDKLGIVHPEKFQRLIKYANLSQAEAFKLAFNGTRVKLSGTSLYCFVGYRDMQRATVLEAGKALTSWYNTYIEKSDKTMEKFKSAIIPPPPLVLENNAVNSKTNINESDNCRVFPFNNNNLSTERKQKNINNFDGIELDKWTYSHIRSSDHGNMFDVLLILQSRPSITIFLGNYPTLALAEKAGALGCREAESYVLTRKKGLNGANLTPVKALRNDKRSIFKNLKRVIPGRVKRQLGRSPIMMPTKSRQTIQTEDLSRKQNIALAPSMTLRKKRRIQSQNFEASSEQLESTKLNFNKLKSLLPSKNIMWPCVRVSHGNFGKTDFIMWHSERYACGNKSFFTSFSFSDDPDTIYKLLDYVLVARPEYNEETNICHRYAFSIGQIEAIYIDSSQGTTTPIARIAWFYWKEETKLSEDVLKHFGCSTSLTEVFSSNDTEEQPLINIYTKVNVVAASAIEQKYVKKGISIQHLLPRELHAHFYVSVGDKEFNQTERTLRIRKKIRSYLHNIVNPRCKIVVCCQHHYDSRKNTLLGAKFIQNSLNIIEAQRRFTIPYLMLTLQTLDVNAFYSENDRTYVASKNSHVEDLGQIYDCFKNNQTSMSKLQQNLVTCGFCSANLTWKPHVLCKVCDNCQICLSCLREKRQGRMSGVSLIHRSSHAYKVVHPSHPWDPTFGIKVFHALLRSSGFCIDELQLIPVEVVRGQSPESLKTVSPRYLFGLRLVLKLPGKQKSRVITVCSKFYGKTVQEAQGFACFQGLSELFGVQTKLDMFPVQSTYNISAIDAMHVIQLIRKHGFSWDIILPKLNLQVLKPTDIKNYYNEKFLPMFFNSIESEEFLRTSARCQGILRTKFEDNNFFPRSTQTQVEKMINDAMLWAKGVKRFLLRRSKLFKNKSRGVTFAVVEKSTVFQSKPHAFGPWVTSSSSSLNDSYMKLLNFLRYYQPNLKAKGLKSMLMEFQKINPNKVLEKSSMSTSQSNNCLICGVNLVAANSSRCDGCDSLFHTVCTPQQNDHRNKFCTSCMEDRSYIYDHTSWGKSGKLLAQIADETIYYSMKHLTEFSSFDFTVEDNVSETGSEVLNLIKTKFAKDERLTEKEMNTFIEFVKLKGLPLPLISKDWEDNNKILTLANRNAILEGWTISPTSQATQNLSRTYSKIQKRHFSDLVEVDRDFLTSVSWCTRHYANQEILSLRTANAALCGALNEVIAQRDALLMAIKRYVEDETRDI